MADDPATVGKSLKKMRFYVTANHNRDYDPETQFRGMAMRCFDVYKISPDEHYSSSLIDRFHLTTDYFTAYGDYDFIHNRGIVDAPNKVNGWDEVTDAEQQTLYANGIGTTVPKYGRHNACLQLGQKCNEEPLSDDADSRHGKTTV